MQRNTSTTSNQAKRSTTAQASRTPGRQSRAANPQVHRTAATQAERMGSAMNTSGSAGTVTCRKCKSTQVVANKKGYSFAKMFITLGWMALLPILIIIGGVFLIAYAAILTPVNIADSAVTNDSNSNSSETWVAIIGILCWISISLSLPVSILVGFIGRNEIINGCMNCGFKWAPAKKK
ncbi:hypothetical protein [Paenibacillus jiagnxiensis]|uniref:hypothetical protein n=1 Tax=Paenibacillus jiagnxiensis TaxID=3228926 RepID=UPI003480A5E1